MHDQIDEQMAQQISQIRAFNRFHTGWVGALNPRLLGSRFTLPEARVIYEIAQATGKLPLLARDLGQALGMDRAALSRLLARLERQGLIVRKAVEGDRRAASLQLTASGQAEFDALDAASVSQLRAMLASKDEHTRADLALSMQRVGQVLGAEPLPVTIGPPRPGDLGAVIAGQAALYAAEYGWDWQFEGLVAEIVAQFIKDFKPDEEAAWIARQGGSVVGSVFVVRQDAETAKLRMLYVDAAVRGQGLGNRLVQECLCFARARGYRRMVLWTNDVLVAARHIYIKAGFELIEEESHHSFGKDLIGQYWGVDL